MTSPLTTSSRMRGTPYVGFSAANMTDGVRVVIPVELVAGPWDGRRLLCSEPLPAMIKVPLMSGARAMNEQSDLNPTLNPTFRVGSYRQREDKDFHTWDRITVLEEAIYRTNGEVLVEIRERAGNPRQYIWGGE